MSEDKTLSQALTEAGYGLWSHYTDKRVHGEYRHKIQIRARGHNAFDNSLVDQIVHSYVPEAQLYSSPTQSMASYIWRSWSGSKKAVGTTIMRQFDSLRASARKASMKAGTQEEIDTIRSASSQRRKDILG